MSTFLQITDTSQADSLSHTTGYVVEGHLGIFPSIYLFIYFFCDDKTAFF